MLGQHPLSTFPISTYSGDAVLYDVDVEATVPVSVAAKLIADPAKDRNARAGISTYGFGLKKSWPASAGIAATSSFEATGGIVSVTVSPPTNVLAAHLGAGTILFQWTPPSNAVSHYELWVSGTAEAGPYWLLDSTLRGNGHRIPNMPIGVSLWFRMFTVHPDGRTSTYAQAKKGKLSEKTFTMDITSVTGSTIAANAQFSVVHPDLGILVTMKNGLELTVE